MTWSSLFVPLMALMILLTALPSVAQRRVNNGGGLGEMKILFLLENLETHLVSCLESANPCALRPDEIQVLREVARSLPTQRQGGGVQFDPELTVALQTTTTWGEALWVRPAALYNEQGFARTSSELGALLLEGLLMKTSAAQGRLIAQAVFKGVHERLESVSMGSMLLHHLRFGRGTDVQSVLVLESDKQSHNLSEWIGPLTACSVPERLRAVSIGKGDGVFTAELQWICDGRKESGLLLLKSLEQMRLVR